jgi:hypothetical protein
LTPGASRSTLVEPARTFLLPGFLNHTLTARASEINCGRVQKPVIL